MVNMVASPAYSGDVGWRKRKPPPSGPQSEAEANVVASPGQVQPKDNEAATHNLLIPVANKVTSPAQLLSQISQ